MLVNIPRFAEDYDDWTDHEKVFMHLMLNLTGMDGALTVFHFYHEDFCNILGYDKNTHYWTKVENLRRIFVIGFVNDDTVTVQYKPSVFRKQNGGRSNRNGKGKITKGKGYVTNHKALNVHYYLMGRTASGDFTSPNEDNSFYNHTEESVIHYPYKWRAM